MAKIESGVATFPFDDDFPFIDISKQAIPEDEGEPLPPVEVWYRPLTNITQIRQGDVTIYISTRHVGRLAEDLAEMDDSDALLDDDTETQP